MNFYNVRASLVRGRTLKRTGISVECWNGEDWLPYPEGVLTIGASLSPMLQQTRWNRKKTAEILGISYKALLYKIKDGGLDKAS